MIRYLSSLIFAGCISFIIFFFLVPLAEYWLLETWFEVQPLPGIKQKTWLNDFSNIAMFGILIAAVATFIWHSLGYFYYRINSWQRAGGRIAWLIILALMLIAILAFGWLSTEPSQDLGKHLASGFYLLNAIIIYVFSSWIFSPSTVKYAPIGSTWFAPIGNRIMRLFY